MKKLFLVTSMMLLVPFSSFAQKVEPTSLYTSLSGKSCHSVKKDAETGSSIQRCPGVGEFSLLVLDDDDRMSLTMVSPGRKEHPLDLWTIVTKSFSTLGEKAEWRVVKKAGKLVPVGLIVRVNANIQEDPEKPQKKSYLAVIKITDDKVCVTDIVNASADANLKARQSADASTNKDCIKP